MATPTLQLVYVSGSAGGPTHHHVSVRVDQGNSSTGDSSTWDKGLFEWRFRIDGAVPTTRISTTDKISGVTRYLDADQHGANANFLALDDGELIPECRYTNSSGERSNWTAAAAVTVTARSGTACYVDGARADDTGNGLSWATAKKSAGAAITLLDTLGDGAILYVRDCTCSTNNTIDTAKNVLVIKDPDAVSATVTITGNASFIQGNTGTDGVGMVGLSFTASDNGGRSFNALTAVTSKNIWSYNCNFGATDDWLSSASGATVEGLSIINATETAQIDSQMYFGGNTLGFLAFGVNAPLGSTDEHSFRFTSGGINTNSAYHSFQYCDIGVATTKSAIRWYGSSNLWVHGCLLRGAVYVGFTSPSDLETGGATWSVTRTKITPRSGQASDFAMSVFSGWSEGTVANCFFNGMGLFFMPRNDQTGDHLVTNTTILDNVFYGVYIFYSTSLNNPVNQTIKNNLFVANGLSTSTGMIQVKNLTTTTGWAFTGNTFDRADASHAILRDQGGTTTYDFTDYAALGFVGDDTRATTTINATTLEPDAGLTTGVASAPFPHLSYYGADRYDPAAANYPSGAWLDPAAALVLNLTYSILIAGGGGLFLSTGG